MRRVYFHGTDEERAEAILANGFDIDARRRSDLGDFGWGIYLTMSHHRARGGYGPAVLRVVVNDAYLAFIKNPYFLDLLDDIVPTTPEELLFYNLAFDDQGEMLTSRHKAVAQLVRDTFLSYGYQGIRTGMRDGETVIFDVAAILGVSHA